MHTHITLCPLRPFASAALRTFHGALALHRNLIALMTCGCTHRVEPRKSWLQLEWPARYTRPFDGRFRPLLDSAVRSSSGAPELGRIAPSRSLHQVCACFDAPGASATCSMSGCYIASMCFAGRALHVVPLLRRVSHGSNYRQRRGLLPGQTL